MVNAWLDKHIGCWQQKSPGALARQCRGATAIEFGLLLPILLPIMMGLTQLGYLSFAQSALEASVTESARSALTGAGDGALSREEAMRAIVEGRMARYGIVAGDIIVTSKVYDDFSQVGQPEPWDDTSPADGTCNGGETFQDINGNGGWDQDMARAGLGGPSDVVAYEVQVPLDSWFSILDPVFGISNGKFTLSATTVVMNEPYGANVDATPVPGVC